MAKMGFEYLDRGLDPRDSSQFTRLELRSPNDPLADLRGSGPPVFVAAQFQACVSVILKGKGAQPGSGELHFGLTPDDNRDAGQTSWTVQVTVTP